MLAALLTTTVVLAILSSLNFIVTMGAVRRLREHAEALSRSANPDRRPGQAGRQVGDFSVATVAGNRLTRADLAAGTILAFFMPGCAGCEVGLPALLDQVRSGEHPDRTVLAVVTGDGDGTEEMIARLRPVVEVVAREGARDLVDAFDNSGYPAFYLLGQEGLVVDSAFDVRKLQPGPVPDRVGG
jgi:hypothetical protein